MTFELFLVAERSRPWAMAESVRIDRRKYLSALTKRKWKLDLVPDTFLENVSDFRL